MEFILLAIIYYLLNFYFAFVNGFRDGYRDRPRRIRSVENELSSSKPAVSKIRQDKDLQIETSKPAQTEPTEFIDYISIYSMNKEEQKIRQSALDRIYIKYKDTKFYPDITFEKESKTVEMYELFARINIVDDTGTLLGYIREHSPLFEPANTNRSISQYIVDVSPNEENGCGYRCKICIKLN